MNPYGIEVFAQDDEGFRLVALIPGTPFGFVWHGGAYIDSIRESTTGQFEINGIAYRYGEECINVWDYETDNLRVPFGSDAMIAEITEYIDGE